MWRFHNFLVSWLFVYLRYVILQQEVVVDDARIEAINNLADRLINQGRTDTEAIRTKKDDLNQQ